jgi:hypothetical protein
VWTGLIWLRTGVVDIAMNLLVPKSAGNFLTGRGTIGFSRRILFRGIILFSSIT